MNKKIIILSLFLIIAIGGFFRLYQLSNQSYWMDEGYTINAVISGQENGFTKKGSSILDSGRNYSCPIYCLPTAYITKIFGNNAFSYRFLSVISGILFILIIFYITRRMFNYRIAILSSFFVSFSYWQIAWSRQARWYTLFALFFWLALYFFYKSLYSEKNKYLNIIFTTVFTITAILTHSLGYLLPLIFIGWILINQIFIQKKFNWKKSLIVIFSGAIALWLLNFILSVDILGYLFNTFQLHYTLPYYLSFYLRNYWLFIVLALIAFFDKHNSYKKETYFLLFTFATYFISLSFFTDIVHYRYLFHVMPVLFILGSLGILNLQKEIKSRYGKIILWIAILGLFATIAGGTFLPQVNYYLESDNPETLGNRPYYAYTPQPDWNSAYTFIEENKTAEEIIISSHPHFNKIFLNEAGYWIKYNYLGMEDTPNIIENDQEYYVGAKVIDDLAELQLIITNSHGYIIFDYMAIDGKIPQEIINYIVKNTKEVFHEKTNAFSQVWIYKF